MKKIIITGFVGKNPETRADQSGKQFVTFSVGVSVGTKQNPKVDWVEVSCSDKLADVAKNYIKKSTRLLVEGFPAVNSYINKENKPVGTLRVYANTIEFISSAKDEAPIDSSNINDVPTGALASDDLPF